MCSSRKACSRRCRSFTFSLNSKFTGASLSAGESRRPFFDEMRHAFLEILGLQARQHFLLGTLKRFPKRLEHRVINLTPDDPQEPRTDACDQITRVFLHA